MHLIIYIPICFIFYFKPGYLIFIRKTLIMAYIYLYSAANEADLREFTFPLILFMVTYEDESIVMR